MLVLVLGRSRSRETGFGPRKWPSAHDFRWLWRWRYTCSHSEHSSQAHQRRWYLGVPPWESRSPPGFLERPPPIGGGLSHLVRARHAGDVARTCHRLFVILVLGALLAVPLSNTSSAGTSLATSGWPLLIAPTHVEGVFYLLDSEPCGETRCLHLYRSRDAVETTVQPALKY